jgi:hypothetical protein
MPTPAIPIMHTDKAKTLCTAREVTGSQRFILSAMYQGSTKTSDQTSVSFRGSTPCNTRGVHINFSEAAFLSAITQRQSMHWRIARIERGHMGGGSRNYESSSRGNWGLASSSCCCSGTAAAAETPPPCTHQSGAELGGAKLDWRVKERAKTKKAKKKRDDGGTSTRSCSDLGAEPAVEVTAAAAAAASSSGGAGTAPAAGSHGEEAIGGLVMRTPVCRYRGGQLRNLLVNRRSAKGACQ